MQIFWLLVLMTLLFAGDVFGQSRRSDRYLPGNCTDEQLAQRDTDGSKPWVCIATPEPGPESGTTLPASPAVGDFFVLTQDDGANTEGSYECLTAGTWTKVAGSGGGGGGQAASESTETQAKEGTGTGIDRMSARRVKTAIATRAIQADGVAYYLPAGGADPVSTVGSYKPLSAANTLITDPGSYNFPSDAYGVRVATTDSAANFVDDGVDRTAMLNEIAVGDVIAFHDKSQTDSCAAFKIASITKRGTTAIDFAFSSRVEAPDAAFHADHNIEFRFVRSYHAVESLWIGARVFQTITRALGAVFARLDASNLTAAFRSNVRGPWEPYTVTADQTRLANNAATVNDNSFAFTADPVLNGGEQTLEWRLDAASYGEVVTHWSLHRRLVFPTGTLLITGGANELGNRRLQANVKLISGTLPAVNSTTRPTIRGVPTWSDVVAALRASGTADDDHLATEKAIREAVDAGDDEAHEHIGLVAEFLDTFYQGWTSVFGANYSTPVDIVANLPVDLASNANATVPDATNQVILRSDNTVWTNGPSGIVWALDFLSRTDRYVLGITAGGADQILYKRVGNTWSKLWEDGVYESGAASDPVFMDHWFDVSDGDIEVADALETRRHKWSVPGISADNLGLYRRGSATGEEKDVALMIPNWGGSGIIDYSWNRFKIDAKDITVDASGFDGNLANNDTDVQAVADEVDNLRTEPLLVAERDDLTIEGTGYKDLYSTGTSSAHSFADTDVISIVAFEEAGDGKTMTFGPTKFSNIRTGGGQNRVWLGFPVAGARFQVRRNGTTGDAAQQLEASWAGSGVNSSNRIEVWKWN